MGTDILNRDGITYVRCFHQIMISPSSVHRTAFITSAEGHYEYLKPPYGLTNSPIVYQRIINKTLSKFIDASKVLVYIDGVLLMSTTVEKGINLLREVLTVLTQAGFSINLRKCVFLTTEIEYLSRIVKQGQVRPSPHNIKALLNAPPSSNVKQLTIRSNRTQHGPCSSQSSRRSLVRNTAEAATKPQHYEGKNDSDFSVEPHDWNRCHYSSDSVTCSKRGTRRIPTEP